MGRLPSLPRAPPSDSASDFSEEGEAAVAPSSDVDEYFRDLGLIRTHSLARRSRRPAAKRAPLQPLVLDRPGNTRFSKSTRCTEVKLVCELLECTASANGKVAGTRLAFRSDFECVEIPTVSITAYVMQLSALGGAASWPAVLSLLDRISRYANMPFTPYTAHRLIAAAYSIITKDVAECARGLPKVARVTSKELRTMEEGLLKLVTKASCGVDDDGERSWDELVGIHDAPAIRVALPKALRAAQREYARRLVPGPAEAVHVLPSYLDCPSSGATSLASNSISSSSYTSYTSSSSFGRRLSEALLASQQS